MAVREFQEQLALDLVGSASYIYQPEKLSVPGRFALCRRRGSSGPIEQDLYDVKQLDWVMRQVATFPERDRQHFWISQATLTPYARNRRVSSVMLLNAAWVDIDVMHPPKGFNKDELPPFYDLGRDAETLAQALAHQFHDACGVMPSQVVATGGGFLLRLDFQEAIPVKARARWTSLQRQVIKIVEGIRSPKSTGGQWGWPVDASASDPARILRLVGTVNPRWGAMCRVVFDSGIRHDFDVLADQLLPYTREEVRAWRANKAQWSEWDANRQAAAAAGIRPVQAAATEDLISDEAARSLWTARYEFGAAVLAARGGVFDGSRNNYFWPLANALAWSCPSGTQLTQDLAALHHQFFSHSGWSRAEAMHAAATVTKRLSEVVGQDKGLYRMKSATFRESLGVTPSELAEYGHLLSDHSHNAKRAEWDEGVMGFQKMQGLSSEDYIAETRRRQAEAGRRSAETRKSTHAPAMREKARQMASEGLKQVEIANVLGVTKGTVSKWLSSK